MRIICFGDSNTWGFNPETFGRHQARWTQVLATLRPQDTIIEEGLNGRTITAMDWKNPERHGMTALPIIMKTHEPVDMVFIMLGTNELKTMFQYGANHIANGLGEMVKWLKNTYNWERTGKIPHIVLAAPICLHPDIMQHPEMWYNEFGEHGIRQSEHLATAISRIAEKYQVGFIDMSRVAEPSSVDYVHMDVENHQKIAYAVAQLLAEYDEQNRRLEH